MSLLSKTWEYFLGHQPEFWLRTGAHLRLSLLALALGAVVGVGLGILAARRSRTAPWVTNIVGTLRAIPSLAIMAAMLPLIGVGFMPALLALTLLAIPPILLNTEAGLNGVDPAIREAAQAMGMGELRVLWQVEVPLAAPVLLAGVRTAAVEVTSSATIGAIIGAGGLGEFVFSGLSLGPAYIHLMLVGAIAIALLTFTAEVGFSGLEALARRRFYR